MKKFLITGMNKSQCTEEYFRQMEVQVVPSHYSLVRCLRDMGWQVEQRAVQLGEDLSGYDEVLVYLHNAQSFAHRFYNGLYAISQRPDAILAFDDWQIRDIMLSLVKIKEDPSRIFRDYMMNFYTEVNRTEGCPPVDEIKSYESLYKEAFEIIGKRDNRLLISAFAGGDLRKLFAEEDWNFNRIHTFNPNPYHLNRKPGAYGDEVDNSLASLFSGGDDIPPAEKQLVWNFASLMSDKTKGWLASQRITWPLRKFGKRRGANKQDRVVEADMCRIYAKQWGCLMPGYYHSGSGWWRARPLQVADAGSILVCDSTEGAVYGEEYVGVTADQIEGLDLSGLIAKAKRQRDCLYAKHPLDTKSEQAEIQAVIDA